MDLKKISEIVSRATWDEATLLFNSAGEIEKDLQNGLAVALQENGELVGFCGWRDYGGWLQLSTIYIPQKFRGQGRSTQLIDKVRDQLASGVSLEKIFLFTQTPALKKIITERYGFRPAKYSELPIGVMLRIVLHRMHPRRVLSYIKYWKSFYRVFAWKLFVLSK